MPADPRGRWFRVYSRQVLQHSKFRDLSHAELGAWLDIRAAVDLMDGQPLADRTEAMLRLRRRTRNPGRLLDRLIEVHLLDELAGGGIAVHDLDDHDKRYPSDDPAKVRERVTKHRQKSNGVTSNGNDVTDVSETTPYAREEIREEEIRGEADADAAAALLGLQGEDDPLTVICGLLLSAAPIEDAEYRVKVDDQTRRYGKDWVAAAYRQAHTDILEAGKRPRRWDLSRVSEVHLAAWTRAEELRQIEQQQLREDAERAARQPAELTPEEKERQELTRKAVGIWIRGGRKGKVPESVDELEAWLRENEPTPTEASHVQ